jgi:FkbM family methyltransferase
MTTKYFLYTKKDGHSVQDITGCQIINPASYAGTILVYPEESIDIHYNHAILEGSLIEWCKQFCSQDSTFLDLGAHTGTYAVNLSPHCKTVYAFEPQERTYYALCASVVLSNRQNIRCLRLGLGSPEQVGPATLYIQNEDGGNSTLCIQNEDKVIRKETVEITTVDRLFAEHPPSSPVRFIKVDVENNELNVLKGAVNTIINNGYPKIIFEQHSDPDQQRALQEFLKDELGYHVQSISGYSHMFLATK